MPFFLKRSIRGEPLQQRRQIKDVGYTFDILNSAATVRCSLYLNAGDVSHLMLLWTDGMTK